MRVLTHALLPLCCRHELLDCSDSVNAAAAAIVDDTFTKCFKSNAPDPWNWNWYLFPLWCIGVVIRYGLLFPIRCVAVQGRGKDSLSNTVSRRRAPHAC